MEQLTEWETRWSTGARVSGYKRAPIRSGVGVTPAFRELARAAARKCHTRASDLARTNAALKAAERMRATGVVCEVQRPFLLKDGSSGDIQKDMHIHLYVDSEFTSFEHPNLLSIAAVTDDSRELYIEVDLKKGRGKVRLSQASTFVIDTVLPQLQRFPTAILPADQVGHRLADWLLELGADKIDVTYDYHSDFDLLEEALREAGRWDELATILVPVKVSYLLEDENAKAAMDRSWDASFVDEGLERHHALADARALREAFHAVHATEAANDDVASFNAEGFDAGGAGTAAVRELSLAAVEVNDDEAGLFQSTVDRWAFLAQDGLDDALPRSVGSDAPLVFLDIDDVICLSQHYGGHAAVKAVQGKHSHPDLVFATLLHFPALRVLEALHKEFYGQLRYVISSTWRLHFNRRQLVEVLNRSGLGFVAERIERKDRWSTVQLASGNRLEEILHWIARHWNHEPFAIIDDTFSGKSLTVARNTRDTLLYGRIVLCDEHVGLLPEHLPPLISALRTPPRERQ